MSRQRVLVTGGTGFVGSNLALALASQGYEVIATDKEYRDTLVNSEIKRAIKPLEDLVDPSTTYWDSFIGPIDVLFHEAAITDTLRDKTEDNPEVGRAEMFRVNLHLSMDLFQKAVKNGCKKIVYASSTAVYGGSTPPYKEGTTKEFPLNVYGASKMALDQWASGFAKSNSNILVVGLRYCNIYGPREAHKGQLKIKLDNEEIFEMASMIYQLAQQISKGKNPRIFKLGEQRRDFIYIDDLVEATILASKAKESCIVNCGSGTATTFNEIVSVLNKVLGTNKQTEYFDIPEKIKKGYQEYTQCDMSLAKAKIGFEPKFDLESGIRAYYESGFLTA